MSFDDDLSEINQVTKLEVRDHQSRINIFGKN